MANNGANIVYLDFQFVDTAIGGVDHRNKVQIIPFEFSEKSVDAYQTYNRFPEEYKKYWQANRNSIKGYKGECYTDFIPLDIDRVGDLNEALKVTQDFVRWFCNEYDVEIGAIPVWFSGSKGLHLAIPISLFGDIEPSEDLPQIIKSIVESFGSSWGFDLSIYDINRLWRVENTIHSKTQLHKIRIPNVINVTLDEILELAKTHGETTSIEEFYEWDAVPSLVTLFNEIKNKTNGQAETQKKTSKETFGEAANLIITSVRKGSRNNSAFEILRHMRYQGLSKEMSMPILENWNEGKCQPPLNQRELNRVIDSVYSQKAAFSAKQVTFAQIQDAIHSYLKLDRNSDYLIDLSLALPLSLSFDHVLWLMIIAASSSGKTEIMRLLKKIPGLHYLYNITSKTLFSGYSKAKGGFIPREIRKSGTIVFPDFTTVLSARPDERNGIFNQLRIAYDGMAGRGTGVDEGEMPHWKGKVAFLGAVTNAIERIKSKSTDLGERFVYFRHATPVYDESYLEMEKDSLEYIRDKISYMIRDFVQIKSKEVQNYTIKREVETHIVSMSKLIAQGRAAVDRDGYTKDIVYVHQAEGIWRVRNELKTLYKCLLCIHDGKDNRPTKIMKAVTKSSIPELREKTIQILLNQNVTMTTIKISLQLGLPTKTTRFILEDMSVHSMVDRIKVGQGKSDLWEVNDDFKKLWDDVFIPS